ncbi:prolipoprotein diacylglyceryl transferase [Bacteroides heparinolyticus]|uniref:prolipoprotein diacylglyceryl transferase n=1 Tax=Prevotella heparinolytica TaxID=28113 RepID=UPI0035A0B195
MLLSINWNPDPELFNLFGSIPIRYYGLLWVVGIGLAYLVVRQQYRDKKIGDDKFEPLFFYCFFGILIGARLGHCLFYQPDYYLNHFWEMILPVHFLPGGGWKWTGYEGLASHGGTLGLIIALWLYCRKTKMHYVDVVDMIAVATPITACCIRLANLMNSEIIGKPTDVPWAFVFERVDMLPRHPAQLYEAIAYFIFFLGMIYLYKQGRIKQNEKPQTDFSKAAADKATAGIAATSRHHRGFFFGLCLTEIFVFRFFIEFLKENQVDFENTMDLNMGQWLSIPFIVIGVYFMFFYGKKKG